MSERGFKTQLKEALTNAVSYFQDTGDPNAACIKAANEAGFNPDQADRLVETFNTARVICHYKAAEDKTSPCSLADKDAVRGSLDFSDTAKVAEAVYDMADYGFYRQEEVDYVVPAVKMAEFTVTDEPLSREAEDWLAVRRAQTIADCVKTAEEEARAAYAMADSLAEKVAMALSRNASIDDVHDRVARIVVAYALDDRYAPGVEKVAEFLPSASDPDESLLHKYASMHVIDVEDLADAVMAIKEAADFAAEGAALEAYVAEMAKQAQQRPPLPQTLPDNKGELENLLLKQRIYNEHARSSESSGGRSSGSGGGGDGGGGIVSRLSPAGPASFFAYLADTARGYDHSGAAKRIEEATASVNNLRRQLILQDLLVNDKVLSQEDPSAVVAAFRSVNQISPDTTLNREMLRSMLRGAVQSVALSPYDAKTLVDVDKARHQAYDRKTSPDSKEDDNG